MFHERDFAQVYFLYRFLNFANDWMRKLEAYAYA